MIKIWYPIRSITRCGCFLEITAVYTAKHCRHWVMEVAGRCLDFDLGSSSGSACPRCSGRRSLNSMNAPDSIFLLSLWGWLGEQLQQSSGYHLMLLNG